MLYLKEQLEALNQQDEITAISRYLHKIHKKETRKLKPHECEFICSKLPYIIQDQNSLTPAYNIYELDFCEEYLFKRLILFYYDHLDFVKPILIGSKYLNDQEIAIDKLKFYELLQKWSEKLISDNGDTFLHEVKVVYINKITIIERLFKNGLFGRNLYERKIVEQKIACFYMYYITKLFFKNIGKNYVSFKAFNETFSINIYSYIHIISRHYIPKMNGIDIEKSFNEDLLCIDPFNLPYSIRNLLLDYFERSPLNYLLKAEYMIFSEYNSFYIIWWKRKSMKELTSKIGYEIRTMYRIKQERDRSKINHLNFHQVNDRLRYYY